MDYIKFSNGQEYRISSDKHHLETRFPNNGQPDWRQQYNTRGKRIVDLREACGQNVECKFDDGKWYETSMGCGFKLTWGEKMNEEKARRQQKAKENKSSGTKMSKKERKEELRRREEEERAAIEAQERKKREEEEEEHRQLIGKIFGFDFENKPYRDQIRTVLTKHLEGEPTDELSIDMLESAMRYVPFETSVIDWFSKFLTDAKSQADKERYVADMVTDFVNTFPDFWNKYPKLKNSEDTFMSYRNDVDTTKCSFFDIVTKFKNRGIRKAKEKREGILYELNRDIRSLYYSLIRAEDELRLYIIAKKRYDHMVETDTGHETNFLGLEKSDSPRNRAKGKVRWCASCFVKYIAEAVPLYFDIIDEHKELSKATKTLYKRCGLQKYAVTPDLEALGKDGIEIVEMASKFIKKDFIEKFDEALISFFETLTFSKEDKNIKLIDKMNLNNLIALFKIK